MQAIQVGRVSFKAIEPAMDQAFIAFYTAVQGNALPDHTAFDIVADAFLRSRSSFVDHDDYFSNFTPLWQLNLQNQSFAGAAAVWPWALRPALAIETAGGPKLHKGTPYYFWAMTELLADKIDNGYLLLHRSFEEDVRTHGSVAPSTPGFAFLTLDHDKQDQAFRSWVQDQATAVQGRIATYSAAHSRTFDLATLRAKYLAQPQWRDAVQLYCYAMARARRMLDMPPQIWEGPFPAQIAFDSLFDLCLVVDAALHEKFAPTWRFIELAEKLCARAGLALNRAQLGAINGMFEANFASTLRQALAGSLRLPDGTSVRGLEASVAIAYGCRNRGAHSVTSVPLTAAEYTSIVDNLNAVFFLTVQILY